MYAVYLYRALRFNLRRPAHWDQVEARIRQAPLMLEEGQDGVWAQEPQQKTGDQPAQIEVKRAGDAYQPSTDSYIKDSNKPPVYQPVRGPEPLSAADDDVFAPIGFR